MEPVFRPAEDEGAPCGVRGRRSSHASKVATRVDRPVGRGGRPFDCVFSGPRWACVLLAFLALAFISLASTGVNAALDDQANPGDIDKSLGNLSVGNVVLVRGRWISIPRVTYDQKGAGMRFTRSGTVKS